MKAVQVNNPGSDSTLEIAEIPAPNPGKKEVLVKIKATALNRADLHQREGKYPPPKGASPILGLEMAGVVEETGPEVTLWKRGDEVFALLPGGGYAEYCTIHEDLAMAVPDGLSLTQAAAVPETFLTAYQALNWLGELKEEETVLIHAGGSGVGTSAIQLSRHLFNARIATTAGQESKLETCRKLGADFAYNYKKQDFAERVVTDIGPESINLIIDFIGEPYWEKNIDVLALDGRIVYLAFLGGHKVRQVSLAPILQKRLSIKGSTLRSRSEDYKIALTHNFSKEAIPLFEQGLLKPVIDSTFDWADTEGAHRRMEENKNTGKIVLTGM